MNSYKVLPTSYVHSLFNQLQIPDFQYGSMDLYGLIQITV